MPTPAERRALLFVAAVAALGLGVRGCRALAPSQLPTGDRAALAAQIAAVDSAVAAGGRPRRSTKAAAPVREAPVAAPARAERVESPAAATPATGPVDLDQASPEELDRLPGIGPALAARIVADRQTNGSFGSLDELQRVRGIGPALASKLAPFVTFSGPRRPPRARGSARPPGTGGPHP